MWIVFASIRKTPTYYSKSIESEIKEEKKGMKSNKFELARD